MDNGNRPTAKVIRFPSSRVRRDPPPREGGDPEPPRRGPLGRIVDAIVRFKARSGAVRRALGLLPDWITPNGVTVFRGALIVPIVLLIMSGWYGTALFMLAFAMLLDFVDGALAHVRNMATESGAFLDPLADKVLVCGVLFASLPVLPGWAAAPVWAICLIAVVLTALRLARMTRKEKDRTVRAKSIAASSAGKMKLLTETASMFVVLGGLSLGSSVMVVIGAGLICVAACLGGLSLLSQLRR